MRKLSPTESARVTDIVVRMRRDGYQVRQIATALGFAPSTVSLRLQQAGMDKLPNVQHPLPAPETIDWSDAANKLSIVSSAVLHGPTHRQSTTVALWRSTLIESQHDNAVNRFANDVRDALDVDDFEWLGEVAHIFGNVRTYLDRLEGVLVDDELRNRAINDPSERDDLARLAILNGGR